jgi:major capsid protein E
MSDTLDTINFPFTAIQLSESVNRIPNNYGLLQALNLFPAQGSISTIIEINIEDGTIRVLPAKERGASSTPGDRGNRKSIFIEVPHFPAEDLITPRDLQNMINIVANSRTPRTLADEMAKRLFTIRGKHSITREWVRMGALKGLITDGNGDTLIDLYAAFGITKKTVDFVLGTAGTDIIAKCTEVRNSIASNLKGEVMNAVEVIVSTSFFNELIQHAKVEKFWVNWSGAQALAQPAYAPGTGPIDRNGQPTALGRSFVFQNILFREYNGQAPIGKARTATPFVADGYGVAYPAGTMNTFETWDAPPNDIRFVNQPGQEVSISPKILDHGEGVELKSQSNPLAICKRPEVLVEVLTSN